MTVSGDGWDIIDLVLASIAPGSGRRMCFRPTQSYIEYPLVIYPLAPQPPALAIQSMHGPESLEWEKSSACPVSMVYLRMEATLVRPNISRFIASILCRPLRSLRVPKHTAFNKVDQGPQWLNGRARRGAARRHIQVARLPLISSGNRTGTYHTCSKGPQPLWLLTI